MKITIGSFSLDIDEQVCALFIVGGLILACIVGLVAIGMERA